MQMMSNECGSSSTKGKFTSNFSLQREELHSSTSWCLPGLVVVRLSGVCGRDVQVPRGGRYCCTSADPTSQSFLVEESSCSLC